MKLNEIDKTKAFIKSRLDVKEDSTVTEHVEKVYAETNDDLHFIEKFTKMIKKEGK